MKLKNLLKVSPIAVFIFILSSCIDTSDFANGYHDYQISYDEVNHYEKCECGDIRNEEEHTFGDYVVTLDATCTTDGSEYRECCICGYKDVKVISALGHEVETMEGVPASCAASGLTDGTKCSRCDAILSKQEALPILEHEFGEWEISIEPTCISKGDEKRTCKNCGYEEHNELDYVEHNPVEGPVKEATCSENGHTAGIICSVCGIYIEDYEVTDKLNHDYSSWSVAILPTCTTKGSYKRTCNNCGAEDTKIIDEYGHSEKDGVALAETCTEEGHTAGVYCTRCGVYTTPQETIEPHDHNLVFDHYITEPNYNSSGSAWYKCKECHCYFQQSIPRIPISTDLTNNWVNEDLMKYCEIKASGNGLGNVIYRNDGVNEYYYAKRDSEQFEIWIIVVPTGEKIYYYHDITNNTSTHKIAEETDLEEFKNNIISASQLLTPVFDQITWSFVTMNCYGHLVEFAEDEKHNVYGTFTKEGNLISLDVNGMFEMTVSTSDVVIDMDHISCSHTSSDKQKCDVCGISCYYYKFDDEYGIEDYLYADGTCSQSHVYTGDGTLKFKYTVITSRYVDTDKLDYYEINQYIALQDEFKGYACKEYSYNETNGKLTYTYYDGDEEVTKYFALKDDYVCRYGDSPVSFYSTADVPASSFMNHTFTCYDGKYMYYFIFTESSLAVQKYLNYSVTVYDGLFLTQYFNGDVNADFTISNAYGYYLDYDSCISMGVAIDGLNITVSPNVEGLDSVTGTIYDVIHLYNIWEYYIETADNKKYVLCYLYTTMYRRGLTLIS